MNEIFLIRLKTIFRTIIIHDIRSFVRALSYFFVVSVFLYFNYFIFLKIFVFLLRSEPEIGYSIAHRLTSVMFSTFFIMLFMSGIVTSVTTFFRTPELEFLFSTPIKSNKIFIVKLIESEVFASWATLIVSIPMMFAIGNAFQFGPLFIIKSILLFLIMVFVAVSCGLFVSFFLSDFFRKRSLISLIGIIALSAILIFLIIFFIKSPDIFNLPKNANLHEIEKYITSLEIEQFRYFPSGIVIEMIFNKNVKEKILFNLILFLLYFILTIVIIIVLMHLYKKKYISYEKVIQRSSKHKNRMELPIFFKKSKITLLIQKDILVFLRDPSQWGQSATFLLLLVFYGISIVRSPIYFRTPFYTYILAFANLGFSTYIMATLSVRFIFPLISLEGRTFSLIKCSVNIRDYFNEKIIFNFLMISILGQILIVGTNSFLGLDNIVVIVSMVVTFVVAIGITAINTGIGAILADFSETNPSKIASGFGGIISAIFSLVYIGLCLGVLSAPTRIYFEYTFKKIEFNNIYFLYAILIVLALTLLIFGVLYWLGLNSLKRRSL